MTITKVGKVNRTDPSIAPEELKKVQKEAEKECAPSEKKLKIAYIMSRFPKITETFILYEMLALEQQGIQVEVYPLIRERTDVMHPEARSYVDRAHYQPFLSFQILKAQLHFLSRNPGSYLATLWTLIRANWGSFRYFTGSLSAFPKSVYLAYLMHAQGVNHLHAHFASFPAAAAFVIHKLVDIPYSFTAHGSDLHRDRHMLCEKVAEASFVVPVSSYNRDVIISECGEPAADKLTIIHCGVDTRVFKPAADNDFGLQSTVFSILCIGTLHEVKGQMFLIQACKLLHERGVNFACYFVGDGPDEMDLKNQVEAYGIDEHIHFLGRRTRDEIVDLLHKVDVVVAPSVPSSDGRREGIPVVLMEAMASGLPVIASRLSGIPELVEDGSNGFLIPPGDVLAIADALGILHEDQSLRQRLGKAGRRKVVQEFDIYKSAAMLADFFRRDFDS